MQFQGILVNRSLSVPLHQQLKAGLRNAILTGQIAPGQRLLSARDMQRHLGVSRNTVNEALAQLCSEGYLEMVRGVGTFVAPGIERIEPVDMELLDEADVIPSASAKRYLASQTPAVNLYSLVQLARAASADFNTAFRSGIPALDLFPIAQFRRCIAAADWTPELLGYDHSFGYFPLREAIARRLQQTRGIACAPEHVVIVGSAQESFSLIARVLLDLNDTAIVEEPGYPSLRVALSAHGARVFAAPVGEEGIEVARFPKRRAKLVYVTPSHQYPTGVVMSLERRLALLRWAAENDAWIVEDDYDSEYIYSDRPQPALQGLASGRRVIYVGTFSKVLSPALHVSYLVIPPSLRRAFQAVHWVTGGAPGMILQVALARFMNDGYFGRHITKTRGIYDERRRFTAAELSRVTGSAFRIRDSRVGLHFLAEFREGSDDVAFSQRAAQRGIIVHALSQHFAGPKTRFGIVIGYGATNPADARAAIQKLAEAL